MIMIFKSYKVLINDIKLLPEMIDKAKMTATNFMIIPQRAHLQETAKVLRSRPNWL